jgi:hypothetical protein
LNTGLTGAAISLKRLALLATLTALILPVSAVAQVYKCKGADGKLNFSDKPCVGAATADIVPNKWGTVSPEERLEAQKRAASMQQSADAIDAEKAEASARQRQANEARERAAVASAAASQAQRNDADAMAACVRDVERRGAPQNVKAEMMAACRTAGAEQRATGSSSLVTDCVRNTERSGASEKEKARQIAKCHGGDVQPEYVERRPAPVAPAYAPPGRMKSCEFGKCSDSDGNVYKARGNGRFTRSDGKPCRTQGSVIYCD